MSEKEELIIKAALSEGKQLYWIPDSVTVKKINSITYGNEGEPGYCANFSGGGYIALWLTDISEIAEVKFFNAGVV